MAIKDFTTLLAPEARQTIRLNRSLQQAISQIVPAAAVDAVALCRIEDEQLHITLTSASWLSRLRFSERAIITALADMNLTANRVRWHVLPGRIEPQRRISIRREALIIPPEAPAKVSLAADQFKDSDLRTALQRVAKTMQTLLDEKKQPRS